MEQYQEREGTVGYTIQIPASTHKRLTVACYEDRRTMKSVMMEAVDEWLKKRAEGGKEATA